MDLQTQRLMMAAAGAAGDKTYVDDVFSTQLWTGNSSSPRTITTGFDMASDGGMVWIKKRNSATESDHIIGGTGLSDNNYLSSNSNAAKTGHAGRFRSLTSTGFEIGSSGYVNETHTYSSWAFKKAEGFFDVVTYTGTGSARTVAHSLGCVPGMVIIKKTNGAENWNVWHKSLPLRDGYDYTRQKLELNTGTPAANLGGNTTWNDTKPSATNITLGTNSEVNGNNDTYVAYFFAGGESTVATARSVEFDGNDYLSIPVNNSDFDWAAGVVLLLRLLLIWMLLQDKLIIPLLIDGMVVVNILLV